MFDDLAEFLHCAALLEADAAAGYDRLAAEMDAVGNHQVSAMFAQFARFSHLHHEEVDRLRVTELGERVPPEIEPLWPDHVSPESPLAAAELDQLTPRQAVETALEAERRACDFYSAVAGQTGSDRVQELAQAFAEEESEHVAHLERWLARYPGSA